MALELTAGSSETLRSLKPFPRGTGTDPHSFYIRLKPDSHTNFRVPLSITGKGSTTQSAVVFFWDFINAGRLAYFINRTTAETFKRYDIFNETTYSTFVGTFAGGDAHAGLNLYKNGSLLSPVASQNGSGDDYEYDNLMIGNQQGQARYFDGVVEEVAFWDHVIPGAFRDALNLGYTSPAFYRKGQLAYSSFRGGEPYDEVLRTGYTITGTPQTRPHSAIKRWYPGSRQVYIPDSGSGTTYNESITLDAGLSIAITDDAILEPALTLSQAPTFSVSPNLVMEQSIQLDMAQRLSVAVGLTFEESLTLAKAMTWTVSDVTVSANTYELAIVLASAHTLSTAANIEVPTVVNLSIAHSFGISTDAVVEATAGLGVAYTFDLAPGTSVYDETIELANALRIAAEDQHIPFGSQPEDSWLQWLRRRRR